MLYFSIIEMSNNVTVLSHVKAEEQDLYINVKCILNFLKLKYAVNIKRSIKYFSFPS